MSDHSPRTVPPRTSLFNAALYSFGNLWWAMLGFAASLVTRGLVAAEAFGASNLTGGVLNYFGAYNSIYRSAISREVPASLAGAGSQSTDSIVKSSYSLLALSVVVQSAALFMAGMLVHDRLLRLALLTSAFLNAMDAVGVTDRILLRSTERFRSLTLGYLLAGVLSATALIVLAWRLGTEGYFLGLVAGAALRFVVFRAFLGRGPFAYLTWRLQLGAVRQVLAVGARLALLSLASQALLTADRWVITGALGTKELGYYSLGSSIVPALGLVSVTIAGSYFPTLMRLVATGRQEPARQGARRAQAGVVVLLVVTFGSLMLLVRPAITTFLPAYESAVPAFRILMLQGYLYGAQAVAIQVHVATDRVWRATAATAACAGASVLLNVFLIRHGLVGAAVATTVAVGLSSLLLNWSADHALRQRSFLNLMVVGTAAMSGLYATLLLAGAWAAWLYFLAVSATMAWRLSRLLAINWRALPASARAYLAARG